MLPLKCRALRWEVLVPVFVRGGMPADDCKNAALHTVKSLAIRGIRGFYKGRKRLDNASTSCLHLHFSSRTDIVLIRRRRQRRRLLDDQIGNAVCIVFTVWWVVSSVRKRPLHFFLRFAARRFQSSSRTPLFHRKTYEDDFVSAHVHVPYSRSALFQLRR